MKRTKIILKELIHELLDPMYNYPKGSEFLLCLPAYSVFDTDDYASVISLDSTFTHQLDNGRLTLNGHTIYISYGLPAGHDHFFFIPIAEEHKTTFLINKEFQQF